MTPLLGARLGGPGLRAAFEAAAQQLHETAPALDSINVYPVPDGDTGSNMAATLRAAVESTASLEQAAGVRQVLQAMARGALFGARGNSGVILSQALRGFAEGAGDCPELDAAALAQSLLKAAEAAYAAVTVPVEGTMLTVLRSAAAAAASYVEQLPDGGSGEPCGAVLEAALAGAEAAELETTHQLPALAAAGLTDAGGEGICVVLRGLLTGVRSTRSARPSRATAGHRTLHVAAIQDAGTGDGPLGFCTEFVVEPDKRPVDIERLRRAVAVQGNSSVLVVGDETGVHVHVHTRRPHALIAAAGKHGMLSRVKTEDMDVQHARFCASNGRARAAVGVLAMSPGAGFDSIFRSLGMSVVPLSAMRKPSAGEIAAAAAGLDSGEVIVLPNHPDLLMTARQATGLGADRLRVVPTASIPQGIAAAVAFDPTRAPEANATAMTDASARVGTIEITTASVSRHAEGLRVRRGQSAAFINGRLAAAGAGHDEALMLALQIAGPRDGTLVTLFRGRGVAEAEAQLLCRKVRAALPALELEVQDGGQALYDYIVSMEE